MTLKSMKTEVQFKTEWLTKLFGHLTEKDILVGGQALSYWAGNYGLVSFDQPVMTDDANLLAPFEEVSRLASELNGIAIYPPRKGFGTAIYGQIEIHINAKEYLNIDVLHKVYGVNSDGIRKRAIKNDNFFIINPIDLFLSKITNYARLTDKQDENGKHQAELSIKIIHCFTEQLVQQNKIKEAISVAKTVFKLGKSTIGKNAINLGVNPFDGIYFEIPDENFQNEWLPRIKAVSFP